MNSFVSEVAYLFSRLPDHRGKVVAYPISEVFFLVTVGMMAGCVDFEDIAEFGKLRLSELRRYMPFINGIPHPRTIARIISAASKSAVSVILGRFFDKQDGNRLHIALDGKHIGDGIFSVSAFETDNCLTIAQSRAFSQGHELSAIKELLTCLNYQGCVISTDAIGCTKEIFAMIHKNQGDAVIAVKGNNQYLYNQIKNLFEHYADQDCDEFQCQKHRTLEKGHGRVEERSIAVLHDLRLLPETKLWPHIKAVAEITSSRYMKGVESKEKRYYAMTQQYSAIEAMTFIRDHWSIENNLHWVLDVNLKEDGGKRLVDNAGHNIASIKRVVLNILKLLKPPKGSMIAFHRKIARDPETMHAVLQTFTLTKP